MQNGVFRAPTLCAAVCLLMVFTSTLASAPARSATLGFSGTFDANDLSGPLMLTVPSLFGNIPVYGYNQSDNGVGAVTSVTGFSSLAGVNLADLTITYGDIERLSTTFSPQGCVPTYSGGTYSNCDTVTSNSGEGDSVQNFVHVFLAGTTSPILTGEILSLSGTTDSNPASPTFATATGTLTGRLTGGVAPYYTEVLAITGGTGDFTGLLSTFDPLCIPGTDPCQFSNAGTISFVPEPNTALLLGIGLTALGIRRRANTPRH